MYRLSVCYPLLLLIALTSPSRGSDPAPDVTRRVQVALALAGATKPAPSKIAPAIAPAPRQVHAKLNWLVSTASDEAPVKVAPKGCKCDPCQCDPCKCGKPVMPKITIDRTGKGTEVYGFKNGVRVGYYLPADASPAEVSSTAEKLRKELPTWTPPKPLPPAATPVAPAPAPAVTQPASLNWFVARPQPYYAPATRCVGSA